MTARWGALALAALALAMARPAEAWNPIKSLASAARRAGRAIGGAAGGFVESATGPAIRNAESSGRRLIADVERTLERQVDHAGGMASKLVGEVDRSLGARLEQVDRSLEARIVQARITADATVDRVFGRLDASVGRLDAMARARIDQVGRVGRDLIARADQTAVKLLAEADAILARRTDDVRRLVADTVEQVDEVASARIEQLDAVAARRLGSVDVIATKQSLGLEGMLLRLAALIGMVGFIAFVLWRLFVEASAGWNRALGARSLARAKAVLVHGAPRFLIQVGLGVAGIAGLYLLAGYLPRDAAARAARQVDQHERALAAAMAGYDFTGVRYHSAQLEILDVDGAAHHRALAAKAELLRDVLGRPALTRSLAGVREVAAAIDATERALGAPDPDLLALKAFVTWRVGETRRDEYDAAALCASALARGGRDGFLLEALARNYLRAFLHDPYAPGEGVTADDLARLRAALPAGDAADSPQFQHLVEYNALVARLDAAASPAYLDMLDAHVAYVAARGAAGGGRGGAEPRAAVEARELRRRHAERVVEAWRVFDGELASSPWLADDPAALAAFTLDDAVLSHALYYTVVPDATGLPPALTGEPAGQLPELVRVKIAPLRVAWARRYAALVGRNASELLAVEEARRFEGFERRASAFEQTYVAFALALRGSPRPDPGRLAAAAAAAIEAAAAIGLYRDTRDGRRSVAAVLAGALVDAGGQLSPELGRRIGDGEQQRRLRFL